MKGKIAFIPGEHKIEFHEYDVPGPPAGGLLAEVTQSNVAVPKSTCGGASSAGATTSRPGMRWPGGFTP